MIGPESVDKAYGVQISEPNMYYICWKPNSMEQYRIFTLNKNYEAIVNASYTDQIALTVDQKLYIQAESSMEYLPSERIQVQIGGKLFKIKYHLIRR